MTETTRLEELQDRYAEKPSEDLRSQIYDELKRTSEYAIDIDSFVPLTHNWVDRGLIMSCENAGHANHRHFKRKK